MQDGRNLARMTAIIFRCIQSGGGLRRESQQRSSEDKDEARYPNPDVEARQDFWSFIGDYIYRNHVAPRRKLYVPKDDSHTSELH